MTTEQTASINSPEDLEYQIPEHVYIQDVLDEMVVMDTHAGEYFELNAAGADILRRLKQEGNIAKLIGALEHDYAPAPANLRMDVLELIAELANRGLIIAINA